MKYDFISMEAFYVYIFYFSSAAAAAAAKSLSVRLCASP